MKLISELIFHTNTVLADGVGVSVVDSRDNTRTELWRGLLPRVTDQSAAIFSMGRESDLSAGVPPQRFEKSQIFKYRPTSFDTQLPTFFNACAFFPSYF